MEEIRRKRELFNKGEEYSNSLKYVEGYKNYGSYDCHLCGEMFEAYYSEISGVRTIDVCMDCLSEPDRKHEKFMRSIFM